MKKLIGLISIGQKENLSCMERKTFAQLRVTLTFAQLRVTFIVSPNEKGLENCIDNPLSTFPRMSLAAKAVATPMRRLNRLYDYFKDNKQVMHIISTI